MVFTHSGPGSDKDSCSSLLTPYSLLSTLYSLLFYEAELLQNSPDRNGNAGARQGTECASSKGSELAGETLILDTRSPCMVPALQWIAGTMFARRDFDSLQIQNFSVIVTELRLMWQVRAIFDRAFEGCNL